MLLRKISAIIFLALALVARADTVTGLVQVATADWSSGTKVVFTPTNTLINIGGVAIRSQPATATVNSSGKFSVNLLGPMGYTVAVGDTFVYPRDVMNISVPGDGGTYDWLALTTNTLLVSTQSTAFILRNNGSGTNTTLTAPVLSSASTGTVAGFVWTATWTNGAGAWLAAGSGSVDTVLSNLVNTKQHGHAVLSNAVATGVLTNPASLVSSSSGSTSNLTVRSLNGVNSLALTVNTNSLVVTNGRVGIGTNAPAYPLHVHGDAFVAGALTLTNALHFTNNVDNQRWSIGNNGGGGAGYNLVLSLNGSAQATLNNGANLNASSFSMAGSTFLYSSGSGTGLVARSASAAPNASFLASNFVATGLMHFRTNTVNTAPTAGQIGQGGFILWSSNGTPWVSRCVDGSTVESKSLF